jgi:hypothetical protein
VIDQGMQVPADLSAKLASATDQVQQTADSLIALNQQTMLAMAANNLAGISSRLDAAAATIAGNALSLSTMTSNAIAQRTVLSASINTEASSLTPWQASAHNSLTTTRMNLALGLNDDAIDRAGISSDEAAYMAKLNGGVAASISGFIATETSRSNARWVSLASDLNVLAVPMTSDVSTAVAGETSRANAAITTVLNNVFPMAAVQTGSNDNTAW